MNSKIVGSLSVALLATSLNAQSVNTVVSSGLTEPNGVAVDYANSYYIADGGVANRILKVTGTAVELLAGQAGVAGADDGIADGATFNEPWGIVYVKSRGGLVVSDHQNQLIRLVNISTRQVSTIAGQLDLINGGGSADGHGTDAQFSFPAGVVADSVGNVYIADMGNQAIRMLSPKDDVSTIITGLNLPTAVAMSDDSTLWVADTMNNQVIRYAFAGGVWTATAVIGDARGGNLDSSSASRARFNRPRGLVWIGGQTGMVVADTGNNSIRNIFGSVGAYSVGTITNAGFNAPIGLALDNEGSILVADSKSATLKAVTRAAQPIPTLNFSSGAYSNEITVVFSTSVTNEHYFKYTTDGSVPALGSPMGSSVTLSKGPAIPLQVRCYSPDFATSTLVSNSYSFYVDTPVLTPGSSNAFNEVSISIGEATHSARLFYTLDGSEPVEDGANSAEIFNNVLPLHTTNKVLKVKGFRAGFTPSSAVTGSFNFTVADPVFSTPGSTIYNNLEVTIADPTDQATVYWTTNDADPTPLTGRAGTKVTIDHSCTLKARAYRDGFVDSGLVQAAYLAVVADPIALPASISTNNPVNIAIAEATDPARVRIRWTTDGADPTLSDNPVNPGDSIRITNNCIVKLRAFLDGFSASQVVSVPVTLTAAPAIITAAATQSDNPIRVTLSSDTTDAKIYWTLDGAEPNGTGPNYVENGGSFYVKTNGILTARAYNDGFLATSSVQKQFQLKAGTPVISASVTSSNNLVPVKLTSSTAESIIYWSSESGGVSTASANWVTNGGTILVGTNGTLRTLAFMTNGQFLVSDVASADFNLAVSPLSVTPGSSLAVNTLDVKITNATIGAKIKVTLTPGDGSSSTVLNYVNAGDPITVTITNNQTMNVDASLAGLVPAQAGPFSYKIQVDKPAMTPASGYYPNGTWVSFSKIRADAEIHYTTDGSTPTQQSKLYTDKFWFDGLAHPKADLRMIKAIAFAPDAEPSDLCTGEVTQNQVSVASPAIIGGAGASIVLPLVVNLQSDQQLRSLQFKMEIAPANAKGKPLTEVLEALTVSANDYIRVAGNSADGYSAKFESVPYTAASGAAGIYFYSIATNLLMTDFGVLANVKVKLPATAADADQYTVSIFEASGTSDAGQNSVPFSPSSSMIKIGSISYLAGDCSPGSWYNAGDFGDWKLDNADVNTAFLASVGIYQPYDFSDAFKAMDVYPETTSLIGDGLITILDWQRILKRSMKLDTSSWVRWWANGSLHHKTGSSPLRSAAAPQVDSAVPAVPTVDIWLRHALVWGETLTNALPGVSYSMPIYAKVLPGFELNALQLRAKLVAEGAAPNPGPVQFVPSDIMGAPTAFYQTLSNDVAFAWSLDRVADPLIGSNLLGYVKFSIPTNAVAGQHYTVRLLYAQAATDIDTERAVESAGGGVWVLSSPLKPVLHVISDQWKTNFFGSLTNPDADADADPDHDGIPNWMEYAAGTNPTNATSHLGFSAVEPPPSGNHGITLRWPAMTGRVYVLESKPTLVGGSWTPVSTNIIGDGALRTFTQTNTLDQSQFYRIRLLQQ